MARSRMIHTTLISLLHIVLTFSDRIRQGDDSAVSSTEQSVVSDFTEVYVIALCSIFPKKCHSSTLK